MSRICGHWGRGGERLEIDRVTLALFHTLDSVYHMHIKRHLPTWLFQTIHLAHPQVTSQRYSEVHLCDSVNPYPTAFPYGNGMVLHFYQQQESSTTKTVHKVINKGLKTYV